jgi:hypothetical protein
VITGNVGMQVEPDSLLKRQYARDPKARRFW